GWTSPFVLSTIIGGAAVLVLFCWIETRVDDPMFDLSLFRIRAFTAGNAASLLASIGRGGLQFMLIIWLQSIFLPLHGYRIEFTPLLAVIYLLPLTVEFVVARPLSGLLSDHFGQRKFATGGMMVAALSFALLMLLPANFAFPVFAALLLLNGIGMGLFAAPNVTKIMNSVPAHQRGAASGMRATFQNTGMVLSIGVFFSLMIIGLTSTLPHTMSTQLQANGVSAVQAEQVAHAPAVGSLFAAFLGYNPMQTLLGSQQAAHLSNAQWQTITGKTFFPQLISHPFMTGLRIAFTSSLIMCLVAAWASWLRDDAATGDEDELDYAETGVALVQEWAPA